jgi:hypothetical protein
VRGQLQAAPVCLPTRQLPQEEGKRQEHQLVVVPADHPAL